MFTHVHTRICARTRMRTGTHALRARTHTHTHTQSICQACSGWLDCHKNMSRAALEHACSAETKKGELQMKFSCPYIHQNLRVDAGADAGRCTGRRTDLGYGALARDNLITYQPIMCPNRMIFKHTFLRTTSHERKFLIGTNIKSKIPYMHSRMHALA
jgi:hypothetical protein